MKSPSSSVGIIESEGIRNGSNRNERITSTIRMIGKNERAYSTTTGSRSVATSPLAATTRCGLRTHASAAQIRPVTSVATTRMNEKSKTKEHPCERGAVFRNCFGYSTLCVTLCAQPSSLLLADLQHREEGFLRNLDG